MLETFVFFCSKQNRFGIYAHLVCLISWRKVHELRWGVGGAVFTFQPRHYAIKAISKPAY